MKKILFLIVLALAAVIAAMSGNVQKAQAYATSDNCVLANMYASGFVFQNGTWTAYWHQQCPTGDGPRVIIQQRNTSDGAWYQAWYRDPFTTSNQNLVQVNKSITQGTVGCVTSHDYRERIAWYSGDPNFQWNDWSTAYKGSAVC